jgi:hypothetical protein
MPAGKSTRARSVAGDRERAERHLDLTTLDEIKDAHGAVLRELDFDAGVRATEPRQEAGEDALEDLRRSTRAQDPGTAALERSRAVAERAHDQQRIAAASQEVAPLRGQPHPALGSIEEAKTQLALEIADLPREGGLRHVEQGRRPREAPRVGDAHEVSKVADVHMPGRYR